MLYLCQIIVCIEIIVCSQSVEIGLAMLYICQIIVCIEIIVVHDQLRLGRLCCTYAGSLSLFR